MRGLALALTLLYVALVGFMVVAGGGKHTLVHGQDPHHAAQHATWICSWMCAASSMIQAEDPVQDPALLAVPGDPVRPVHEVLVSLAPTAFHIRPPPSPSV